MSTREWHRFWIGVLIVIVVAEALLLSFTFNEGIRLKGQNQARVGDPLPTVQPLCYKSERCSCGVICPYDVP